MISNWRRTAVRSREYPGFAVSPLSLCVKLAPKTSDRAVPFRQVILIINIAHINIGLGCSVIILYYVTRENVGKPKAAIFFQDTTSDFPKKSIVIKSSVVV